jgi:thiamine biosynthesis lipoprotein
MKFWITLLISFSLLAGCGDTPQTRQAKFYAFGTEIDVSLYGADAQTAEKTIEGLTTAFDNVNNQWHAWQPSTLTHINEAIAKGESIAVTEEVSAVIEQAKAYAKLSHHLFNPAAGKLFALWGYHQDDWFTSRPPPPQDQIDDWLAHHPTMESIHIDAGQISSDNPYVKLGFGGFAKGTAVDAAIASLRAQGINNAIINIGGDLRAIGMHGDRPWRIGIRHPRKEGQMMAAIELHGDESVFTSGDYERYFVYEGKRYPHILDPRTGYPASGMISATVVHQQAALADAAATAMIVAGDEWPTIAQSMGLEHVMLMRADGQIEMTPSMAEKVILIGQTSEPIIRPLPTQP